MSRLAAASDYTAYPTVPSQLELASGARCEHVLDGGLELHGCELSA
jgi:hypothetical protein